MAICPTCGKQFKPCMTATSAFNWRRIACSYECAQIYVERIREQRRQSGTAQSMGKCLDEAVKRDVGINAFGNK